MNTRKYTHLFCCLLPLAFAGCAHDRSSVAVTGPARTAVIPPTSQVDTERVYSSDSSPIGRYAPPPGAPADDWSISEEVRALLTSDKKLTREPMATVVNKGVVTLQGKVPNERQRQRIEQAVASLPGVTRVDNQLVVQNVLGNITGKSKEY